MNKITLSNGAGMIIGALVWASAIIGVAIIFKGNPAKAWIESALYIGSFTFLMFQLQYSIRTKNNTRNRCRIVKP